MSKTSVTAKRTAWWTPGWSWKVWAMLVALLIPTLGFAVWVLSQAGGQTSIDPRLFALAGENAGGEVTAITGTEHTVYHASAPLPDARAPRADKRDTLIWFTSQSCSRCEGMLFAHTVMNDYRERVVFVEKAIDRDPAAALFGIEKPPVFVLIDAEGHEEGRFEEAADEADFRAQVERLLR